VTCATNISGSRSGGVVLGPGSTCIVNANVAGSVTVPKGAVLDLEGATISASIIASGPGTVRLCGTTIAGSLSINGATGFVLIGDTGDDACAANTISGSLTLQNNTGGVEVIGNHVGGRVTASGNSGTGPFPDDTGPDVSGNGP
jgi:hypothetical protein